MTNAVLRDSVLFKTQGSPVTDLEWRGENLVLYTENDEVYQRFKKWKQLLRFIEYQQHDSKGKRHIVGADLFFPKTAKKSLLMALQGINHSKRN